MKDVRNISVKKIKKRLVQFLCVFGGLTIVCLCMAGVYNLGKLKALFDHKNDTEQGDELFGDVYSDDVDITIYDVEHKISELGELATGSDNYVGVGKIENVKTVDLPVVGKTNVIGTYHCIEVNYSGVIKAGYDLSKVDTSIDTVKKEIKITLPEVQILDNYIDSYTPEVTNNSLTNPVRPEEISAYLEEEAKEAGLKQAEERGIYETAEESAIKLIEDQLSCFTRYGYKVVVVSEKDANVEN